jgi:hypothetical protein
VNPLPLVWPFDWPGTSSPRDEGPAWGPESSETECAESWSDSGILMFACDSSETRRLRSIAVSEVDEDVSGLEAKLLILCLL